MQICFYCESIIVATELHQSKGYHYHVGILNDTASRHTAVKILRESQRETEVFYILCPASSLMDVPEYVNSDKLMNVPIGFVCDFPFTPFQILIWVDILPRVLILNLKGDKTVQVIWQQQPRP